MILSITQPQRDLIDDLRVQRNISPDVLDTWCLRHWGTPVSGLNRVEASVLIDFLKDKDLMQRELQLIAGQQSLFGEERAS